MPETTARASSLEISGILLHLEAATGADSSINRPRSRTRCDLPPSPRRRPPRPPRATASRRSDWKTLAKLLPYVWAWRWRVLVALAFLVAAKLANIGVPLVLKSLVDALALKPGDPRVALVVPVAILLAYGALRALDHALHRAARVPVLSGRGADRAARLARGVRAPAARFQPALSPRAPDRRRLARHRARLALDPVAAQLHDLQHPADAGRDHDGDRPALGEVRRLVRGDHLRRAGDLHRASRSPSPNGAPRSGAP